MQPSSQKMSHLTSVPNKKTSHSACSWHEKMSHSVHGQGLKNRNCPFSSQQTAVASCVATPHLELLGAARNSSSAQSIQIHDCKDAFRPKAMSASSIQKTKEPERLSCCQSRSPHHRGRISELTLRGGIVTAFCAAPVPYVKVCVSPEMLTSTMYRLLPVKSRHNAPRTAGILKRMPSQ